MYRTVLLLTFAISMNRNIFKNCAHSFFFHLFTTQTGPRRRLRLRHRTHLDFNQLHDTWNDASFQSHHWQFYLPHRAWHYQFCGLSRSLPRCRRRFGRLREVLRRFVRVFANTERGPYAVAFHTSDAIAYSSAYDDAYARALHAPYAGSNVDAHAIAYASAHDDAHTSALHAPYAGSDVNAYSDTLSIANAPAYTHSHAETVPTPHYSPVACPYFDADASAYSSTNATAD